MYTVLHTHASSGRYLQLWYYLNRKQCHSPRSHCSGEVTMALGRPIVGIVADVHRHMEGHHYAEVSSVFGLDSEEFRSLQQAGVKIKPAQFEKAADRFQV